MRPVKCLARLSGAYLCDRTINELCLYLCTSSNGGRWAAFAGHVLSEGISVTPKMLSSGKKQINSAFVCVETRRSRQLQSHLLSVPFRWRGGVCGNAAPRCGRPLLLHLAAQVHQWMSCNPAETLIDSHCRGDGRTPGVHGAL